MKHPLRTLLLTTGLVELPVLAQSFATQQTRRTPPHTTTTTRLNWWAGEDNKGSGSGSGSDSDSCFDDQARRELSERLQSLNRERLEQEWERPPNVNCSPEKLVEAILRGLWDSDDPLPDSGFLLLLRTATPSWRTKILKSIGAPTHHKRTINWDLISSALGAAMARPRNQFGILVAAPDDQESKEMPYFLDFPFEPLDYDDGTAWIECRMRDQKTNELLVITGWTLQQREEDGAWMVDSITWHDLREEYRPGIGQTEWMRICR